MLEQHFGDLFVFDPIVVEVRKDHDDIDYVHAYVVFDGDFEKLEPSWTVDLPEKLLPHTRAMGIPRHTRTVLRRQVGMEPTGENVEVRTTCNPRKCSTSPVTSLPSR